MKRTLKQIVENHIALKSFFILYKHYNNNKITLSELLVKKPYKLQKYLGFPCKTTLPLQIINWATGRLPIEKMD